MIIALNNKCNLNKNEFIEYQNKLENISTNFNLIMCPSSLNISMFNSKKCHLGSQNVSKDLIGAHTGEIAASQLKTYNVEYCIVGHSERRKDQHESNEDIALKIDQLFKENIIPILCVGETEQERKENNVSKVIKEEITIATKNLTDEQKSKLIVAYEPIWSIGTGLIPTNEQIKDVFTLIKNQLPNTKVLYGGSANEKNIDTLKEVKLIDGYLLGGLSLKPDLLQIFINKLEN